MSFLKEAIARLKSKAPSLTGGVSGATELEDAVSGAIVVAKPTAFILALGESSGPDENATCVISQRVSKAYAVVLAVPNANKLYGVTVGDSQELLETLREEVMNAMLGWTATGFTEPTTAIRGRLVNVENRLLWWQDEFQIGFHRRKYLEE